jgi:hypothetical protein
MTSLAAWETFYVIVGSSAGALTGLQFVMVTIAADLPITDGIREANQAFSTPTIIHFSTVLLLSAILTAPWPGIAGPAALAGVVATVCAIYTIVVARRMRAQSAYKPVFEDWLFHALLPFAAYVALVAAAIDANRFTNVSLFTIAAASLLLLFVGIHNAWDGVTYLVFVQRRRQRSQTGAGGGAGDDRETPPHAATSQSAATQAKTVQPANNATAAPSTTSAR